MTIDERCIRQTEAEMVRLKQALSEAHGKRAGSPSAKAAWKAAAEDFHRYESPLFALWSDEARDAILQGKGAWREGAIHYLALSPRFHRSGYLRDRVCHLLKRCALSEAERDAVLHALLETLIRQPSTGRFRHDCQLAARWADDRFTARIRELSTRKDGWTRGRAIRMLEIIEQNKRLSSNES